MVRNSTPCAFRAPPGSLGSAAKPHGSAAMGLGSAAHTSLSISPLELEETVRRQLEQVLRDGQRGLAALQRWDGDGPDGDENVVEMS